jgi:hypothetical protein
VGLAICAAALLLATTAAIIAARLNIKYAIVIDRRQYIAL